LPNHDSDSLTPEERAILDFELSWTRHRGTKKQAVAQRFGLPLATYYRRRAKAIARPAAAAYAPALVRRLGGTIEEPDGCTSGT
jgi:hypothetical protein